MKEKTLKSGAVLGLQLAAFEDSMALLDSILKEMVGVPIEGTDLKELVGKDVSQLKDVLFKVISSKPVKEALWACLGSCTYQPKGDPAGQRITRETFQLDKARADFFPVAGEVATFNLAPFFENLELPSSVKESLAALAAKPPEPSTA